MTAKWHCWSCGAVFGHDEAVVVVDGGGAEIRCPACGSGEVAELPAAEKAACECCGGEGVYCGDPCPCCGGRISKEVNI
ncbi:MAG TPA: hypothetical protein VM223_25805 [Planctomycetota bacterium]|nr:hypothetical protein [Planctomycetota bacterium]